MPTKYLLFDPM